MKRVNREGKEISFSFSEEPGALWGKDFITDVFLSMPPSDFRVFSKEAASNIDFQKEELKAERERGPQFGGYRSYLLSMGRKLLRAVKSARRLPSGHYVILIPGEVWDRYYWLQEEADEKGWKVG